MTGPSARAEPPLCVDLDGSLIACDSLHHLLVRLVRTRPWHCFDLPLQVLRGRAHFKARVSDRIAINAHGLPYRINVLDYLREQRAVGRRLVLATAAEQRIADAVATHLDIFDAVYATRGALNLRGERKRDVIRSEVAAEFDYIGDSWADLPVFEAARYALLVAPPPRLRVAVEASCRLLHIFD